MAWLMMATTALPLPPYPSCGLSSSQSEALGTSISFSSFSTPSLSLSSNSVSPIPFVYCGRGDRKTAKGKRFNHSFGNARPRNKKRGRGPPRIPVPSSPPNKDSFDNEEVVKIDIDESLS